MQDLTLNVSAVNIIVAIVIMEAVKILVKFTFGKLSDDKIVRKDDLKQELSLIHADTTALKKQVSEVRGVLIGLAVKNNMPMEDLKGLISHE